MAKLIQMTENSWLVKNGDKSAIIFKNSESNYELLSEFERKNYDSFDKIEKRFGKLSKEDITNTVESKKINGFNVKHTCDIDIIDNNSLPVYTKKDSKIEFVAGYWLLNFKNSNGWTLSNCPKKSTIENNEAEGPFLNRLEALNRIAILNSKKEI